MDAVVVLEGELVTSSASMKRRRWPARSSPLSRGHGPLSNSVRALAIAESTSSVVASATSYDLFARGREDLQNIGAIGGQPRAFNEVIRTREHGPSLAPADARCQLKR